MRLFAKWLAIIIVGIALGAGAAVWQVRAGALGEDIRIGPWTTGRDIGTADADARTRAIVALRGLLALPKQEALYYTARTDSAGVALSGKCRYTLSGGALDARWWSITLYDREGWLIPNRWNRHSIGSAAVGADADGRWSVTVAPQPVGAASIPTGTDEPFELTLRAYRPRGAMATDPGQAAMPSITRGGCVP